MIDLQFPYYSVKNHLLAYLGKLSSYSNFDCDMLFIVYQDARNNEFIAFESMVYNISFFSSFCKPSQLIFLHQDGRLAKYKLTYNQLVDLLKEPIRA